MTFEPNDVAELAANLMLVHERSKLALKQLQKMTGINLEEMSLRVGEDVALAAAGFAGDASAAPPAGPQSGGEAVTPKGDGE